MERNVETRPMDDVQQGLRIKSSLDKSHGLISSRKRDVIRVSCIAVKETWNRCMDGKPGMGHGAVAEFLHQLFHERSLCRGAVELDFALLDEVVRCCAFPDLFGVCFAVGRIDGRRLQVFFGRLGRRWARS